jgi:FixJ family two-component response regulator
MRLEPSDGWEAADVEPVVYVIDPDANTCNAVRELVGTMRLRCVSYASGREFLEACSDAGAGCVVLETRIPEISGIEIQRFLKARGNDIPVIFLTAYPEISIAVEAMRLGAVHFLQKPLHSSELWNAVQEAIDADRKNRREQGRRESLKERLASLSAKELEMLSLIGQGKSNRQIAAHMKVGIRSVEARRVRLAKKIRVSSLRDLLEIAIALASFKPSENRTPSGPKQTHFGPGRNGVGQSRWTYTASWDRRRKPPT